ncbi:hypothetical protein AAF712_000910 [Marasmius tenuissimus]|uniref:Uncharacterized protein n=1 Tax=Marasmius tenuissimus TaxID=585030 RepID=A0ABR3ADI2_9AGAR|nr:hypothetical protein PM082_002788 [Marasmius tenuissimus]
MSSSLSKVRSIAVSYGLVLHPTPDTLSDPAHSLAINIINHLWQNWGVDDGGLRQSEVDLYNVNIPLIMDLMAEGGLPIYWTTIWRSSYGQLFKQIPPEKSGHRLQVNPAGPDAGSSHSEPVQNTSPPTGSLVFKWSPRMEGLITPSSSSLIVGSDGWAINEGAVSVTPLRASFAEPPQDLDEEDIESRRWKIKL